MNKLEISEIQILPVKPQNGLVAFCSFILNNQFYVGNIAIYTSPSTYDDFRLVYPSKILPTGKQINCFHPINREAGNAVKKSIISQYEKLMERLKRE